uniref:Uncharacterized protein n=1 Tax=Arundo donax TaxID=35708 RepID=A0A0A9SS88_ARUDO
MRFHLQPLISTFGSFLGDLCGSRARVTCGDISLASDFCKSTSVVTLFPFGASKRHRFC